MWGRKKYRRGGGKKRKYRGAYRNGGGTAAELGNECVAFLGEVRGGRKSHTLCRDKMDFVFFLELKLGFTVYLPKSF